MMQKKKKKPVFGTYHTYTNAINKSTNNKNNKIGSTSRDQSTNKI